MQNNLPLKTKLFDALRSIFKLGPLEKLLVATRAGKKVNSFGYRLIPRIYSYAQPTWRTKKVDGFTVRLNISNFVDHAFYFGIGDPGLERLKKMIRKNWTILDVGANIGTTALTFASLVPEGKVVAFEPNAKNFSRLSENVSLNGSKNISLQNTGLGEQEERVKLYIVEESNPGMNRVLGNLADNNFASEIINIKRLDDFIEIEQLKTVNLIKIDVEGFEFKVLKGAERIMTQFKPVLFIELNDAHLVENGASAAKLLSLLFDKGYNIFAAESMHQINRGDNLYKPHFDIICLPGHK